MFSITSKGNFSKTRKFFDSIKRGDIYSDLDRYGREGVEALSRATPQNTGRSAISWDYRVIKDAKNPGIEWFNTNRTGRGTPIVILIQYGHGTGTGGYVPGFDFINPAIKPIFDKITDNVWKKVKS